MRLLLACALTVSAASAAAATPDQAPAPTTPQPKQRATGWSLLDMPATTERDRRLPSPSQLDDLMQSLPLVAERGPAEDKGFSFRVKPGKTVRAVARLRF